MNYFLMVVQYLLALGVIAMTYKATSLAWDLLKWDNPEDPQSMVRDTIIILTRQIHSRRRFDPASLWYLAAAVVCFFIGWYVLMTALIIAIVVTGITIYCIITATPAHPDAEKRVADSLVDRNAQVY